MTAALHLCERCRRYTATSTKQPCDRCMSAMADDWASWHWPLTLCFRTINTDDEHNGFDLIEHQSQMTGPHDTDLWWPFVLEQQTQMTSLMAVTFWPYRTTITDVWVAVLCGYTVVVYSVIFNKQRIDTFFPELSPFLHEWKDVWGEHSAHPTHLHTNVHPFRSHFIENRWRVYFMCVIYWLWIECLGYFKCRFVS